MQYLLVKSMIVLKKCLIWFILKICQKKCQKFTKKCPQEFTHKISPKIRHFCPLEFFHPIWSLKLHNCNFNKKYWIQSTFNSSYTMKCQTSWLIKEKVLLFMHCKLLGGPLTEKKFSKVTYLHFGLFYEVSIKNFLISALKKLDKSKFRKSNFR